MARCGCNDECSCLILEGPGIDILGSGSANNPYTVEFDGSEVIASGLAWNDSTDKLSTKLAAGGGLEFDGAGAMKVVGGGGPAGGTGWTTITDLENRGEKVMIGHTGAGYMIKPEGTLRSYQYGQQIGVDMMSIAVRFLNDGTPVVCSDETLGRTIGEPWNAAAWTGLHVQELDGHRWGIYPQMSGLDNPYLRNQPDGNTEPTVEFGAANWAAAKWQTRSPSFGFLGYREQPQYGGTFLADVFREVGGRTPLFLELRWPARDAVTGVFIRPTPAVRTDRFLRNVLSMIGRFGLTNHVVVTSTETSIPAQGVGNVDVLATFSGAGIRVGPFLTPAKLATYPANGTWPATWTWASFNAAVTDAQIAAYHALTPDGVHPLRCVLAQINRQSTWQQRVTTPGLLGGTSADPPYAFALAVGVPNHPLSGPTYRNPWAEWIACVVQHGTMPPTDVATQTSPWYRGIKEIGVDKLLMGPSMVSAVAGTSYHVLQGWGAPLPTPTNVYFDFEVAFDAFETPRTQSGWLAFAFARNTDATFSDWNPAPGVSVDAQSGYVLLINQLDIAADGAAKNVVLLGYTAGAVSTMGTARTAAAFVAGTAKRIRVGLNGNGVRVSAVQGDLSLVTLIESRTDLAKAYRGEYFHLGRYSAGNQGWYGWWRNFRYQDLGGTAAGPP